MAIHGASQNETSKGWASGRLRCALLQNDLVSLFMKLACRVRCQKIGNPILKNFGLFHFYFKLPGVSKKSKKPFFGGYTPSIINISTCEAVEK